MPKKTKKSKLIAEYRRKIQSVSPVSQPAASAPVSGFSAMTAPTYGIPASTHAPKPQQATIALKPEEFAAIRKDLFRTLILISLTLTVELAIWRFAG